MVRDLKIQNTNNRTTVWPCNSSPRYIAAKHENTNSTRSEHTDVHSSTVYNSQDMEATHVSINTLLDKEDMNYIYPTLYIYACVHTHTHIHSHTHTGILLSHKKNEILSFVAMWMDLKNSMLNKINQRRKTNTIHYYLYGESKNNKNNTSSKTETDWQV